MVRELDDCDFVEYFRDLVPRCGAFFVVDDVAFREPISILTGIACCSITSGNGSERLRAFSSS